MSKKTVFIFVIAGLVALGAGLWFASSAFAKEDGFGYRLRIARRGLGQVISIGDERFIIQRRDGETFTILVDRETSFRGRQQEELSYADLKVDGWVVVVPTRSEGAFGENEEILACTVFILPQEFDPSQFRGARGLITTVDIAVNQFSLETDDGEQLIFNVDEETRFWGEIASLEDLEPKMRAIVRSQEMDDGSLRALGVLSPAFERDALQKNLGLVSEVDPVGGEFSIQLRGSEAVLTFQVDEVTRFRSREQTIESLDDLQPDMIVAVGARPKDDGTLQAIVVIAATRDQLPDFESRIAGRVTGIGNNSFTIHARNGESYSILVTGDTVFRSQNGQVQSLDDLQIGMLVIVGGKELGNGQHQYQAKLVLVLPRNR